MSGVVNPWVMALPLADTEQVINTFVTEFYALALAEVGEFEFAKGETVISKRLTRHLQAVLPTTLQSGFWDFEPQSCREDMTDFRRLDITYSTVWDKQNMRLIFECKKLYAPPDARAKRSRREYVDQGVHRFVRGSYAPMDPAGFMVAFVQASGADELKDARANLTLPVNQVAMRLRDYGGRQYWKGPPTLFNTHVDYETCHLRDSPYPELTLYHLALRFP